MRTAAELIRDATATGTYTQYMGDGASVPWQFVLPPFNFLLYMYKRYLDRRWPEAFRLHDWCYTPYGALIGVTKEEADAALYEVIAVDSEADAARVYAAVRLGPAGVFGSSLTGFPVSRPNMALTNRSFTMPTKVVMLFKGVAGASSPTKTRIAGWSESLWHPSDDLAEVLASLRGRALSLLPVRAAMLPSAASISGVKLYQGGAGRGSSAAVSFPGNPSWVTDVPQMALQVNARSLTTGQTRRWRLHAIPDQFVVQGIFQPNSDFSTFLGAYFFALGSFGWYSRPANPVRLRLNTVVQIPPVPPATASSGLVTTIPPHSFVAGDNVTFYSTVLGNGQKYTVTRTVISVVSAQQFVVANWTAGNTTEGNVGTPLRSFDLFTPANCSTGSITTVKVGRPFDLYRGRRSSRRQTA